MKTPYLFILNCHQSCESKTNKEINRMSEFTTVSVFKFGQADYSILSIYGFLLLGAVLFAQLLFPSSIPEEKNETNLSTTYYVQEVAEDIDSTANITARWSDYIDPNAYNTSSISDDTFVFHQENSSELTYDNHTSHEDKLPEKAEPAIYDVEIKFETPTS